MKRIRRILLSLFLVLMTFTNVSFASEDGKVLRVGMEVNYAPFNFSEVEDQNGGIPVSNSPGEYANGYDVAVAKRIADELGMELEIYKIDWDGLIPALTSGKIDAIVAGMSPTEERLKQIDFTDSYYNATIGIVTRKDSEYSNAHDINDYKDAKITGQLGTFHYDLIDQMDEVSKQQALDSFPTMITATVSGTIDGYVSDKSGAMIAIYANTDLSYRDFNPEEGFDIDPMLTTIAVGVKKGSPLKNNINNALKNISQDEQDDIMDHMIKIASFGEDQSKDNLTFFQEMQSIWSRYSSLFLKGIVNTLFIAIVSTILGFLLGLLVAIIRKTEVNKIKNPIGYGIYKIVNFLLGAYVEIFRGTPMMVQSVIIFYGLKQYFGIDLSTMFAAILIVSINTGAYLSEVVRGGINSINKGQFEACKALGMTHWQTMKNVIIPQTVRTILPSLGNEFVINIKDTSVLNVISVTELFFMSKSVAGSTYQYFPTYLITALIYFILTFVITRILLVVERRLMGREYIKESSTGAKNVNN
ncbi:ABC transporter substrate-binding protein/permease [Anaerococcus sp. DFU013_CI05]|uniref:ABC transporter substrate-binding protein/permease n=1 Tax=Anaerococcus sp. AH8042_DFU013_CI05 TaxID=3385202 RepID=UPI003A521B31